jgi:methyl-accepting chemotaxis protein
MEPKKQTNSIKMLWIFGVLLLSIVFVKKEWRTRVLSELKQAREETSNAIHFIRENREQILDQVKTTANEVSCVVRDISNDVKVIGKTASHLRESSEEIVKATKEAAKEMKSLRN